VCHFPETHFRIAYRKHPEKTAVWCQYLDRYTIGPLHRRTDALPNGTLEFRSETVLHRESGQLRVRERFDIEQDGVRASTENDFVMRCWTQGEIAFHLSKSGLEEIARHPTYGEQDLAWSDRLVEIALKPAHHGVAAYGVIRPARMA
jgi:hypothetical protein